MLVFEMVQDHSGLIWMRDYNSIGIFDGKKFRNVTKQLEKMAGGSIEVFDIHADLDGQIWVSCNFGVFRYISLEGFRRLNLSYQGKTLQNVSAISDDCDKNFIFGTMDGHLYKTDIQTGKILTQYDLPKKSIIKYIHSTNAALFVSSNHGIFKCFDTGVCSQIYTFNSYNGRNTFADNQFQKIKSLHDGRLLANTIDNKLLIFNANGALLDSIIFNLKSTDRFIHDWIELSDKNIFFATTDGVFNYNPETKVLKKRQKEYLVKNQFYNTQFLSLLLTKNQVIYLGTPTNISKINIQNEQFLNYNYVYPSRTVLVKEIPALNHQWLIVTEEDGLLLFDPIQLKLEKILDLGKNKVELAT